MKNNGNYGQPNRPQVKLVLAASIAAGASEVRGALVVCRLARLGWTTGELNCMSVVRNRYGKKGRGVANNIALNSGREGNRMNLAKGREL